MERKAKAPFALFLLLAGIIGVTNAVDSYQGKCTVTEGNGIRIDSCDARQFLTCQSGRCLCNDLGNQIFDYIYEPETHSRSKRGTKKKIAAGAIGGAAVGYIAGKAVSKGSGKKEVKTKKVFSCYGRVGSPCALDFNNVNVVTLSTTSTTTTAPPTTLPSQDNSTTTAAPTTTVTTTTGAPGQSIDITKLPKCIRNAVCVPQKASNIASGGHIRKVDNDPRIGVCECAKGYGSTASDQCKSGAGGFKEGISLATLMLAVFISKLF